jgi:hypothetical protein
MVRLAPNKRPNKLSEVVEGLAEVVTNEGERVLWAGAKAPAKDAAKASVTKLNFIAIDGRQRMQRLAFGSVFKIHTQRQRGSNCVILRTSRRASGKSEQCLGS